MKPCNKAGCAAMGHFEGDQCPGSDDEMHHCVDCGELAWEDKGNSCDRCGAYWCVDWQTTFIFFDCESVEADQESVCSACFLADPKLWCTDPECKCECKKDKVQSEYDEFKARGSLCGGIRLSKDNDLWTAKVYRYPRQVRARLLITEQNKKIEFQLADLETAVEKVISEVNQRVKEGYVPAEKTSFRETNPWGKFADIKI